MLFAEGLRAAALIDKPVRRQATPAASPACILAIVEMCYPTEEVSTGKGDVCK